MAHRPSSQYTAAGYEPRTLACLRQAPQPTGLTSTPKFHKFIFVCVDFRKAGTKSKKFFTVNC